MMIHNFLDYIIVHVNVNAFSKSLHAFVRIPSSLVVIVPSTLEMKLAGFTPAWVWDQKTIPVHPADGYLT